MAKLKTLIGAKAIVEFAIQDDDWCQLSIISQENRYELGAESFQVLIHKLLNFFYRLPELTYSREMDGLQWAWFLSLSEKHGSLYARKSGDSFSVRARDAGDNQMIDFDFTIEEAKIWRDHLENWLHC